MKKWYSGDRGIVEATMPFRNSCACKPVTESTALRGTGATVGVFRNSERTAGGSMVVEAKVAERSSESAYSPLSLPSTSEPFHVHGVASRRSPCL